jgi:hypothetical protein
LKAVDFLALREVPAASLPNLGKETNYIHGEYNRSMSTAFSILIISGSFGYFRFILHLFPSLSATRSLFGLYYSLSLLQYQSRVLEVQHSICWWQGW